MRVVIYKLPNNEKVLYNLGHLLEKLYQSKQIGILCDKDNIDFIDKNLWIFSSNAFLPHEIAIDNKEVDDLQPILLSNNLSYIDREILCVFNKNDLLLVISNIQANNVHNVDIIIYMTQEDVVLDDMNKINNVNVDIFNKDKNGWKKILH